MTSSNDLVRRRSQHWLLAAAVAALAALLPVRASAQAGCGMRADLAANPGVAWTALRAACQAEQDAFWQNDPRGAGWFANAANGFSGFPYILQRVLPDLAPEIWGRPEDNFARFGFFPDRDPARPLPRGLGVASTAGRPVDAANEATGEIDFAKPGLHVVNLACGACHTGQVRTDAGPVTVEGAPNTQMDVRKWREAYGLTVQRYLANADQVKATAARLAAIIDGKPPGYFYPPAYFNQAGFLNFSPAAEATQRGIVKANLGAVLSGFACGLATRATGQVLQSQTSYGTWNAPGLSGFSTGQQDGSGDLIFQLLVANAIGADECQPGPDGAPIRRFDPAAFMATLHPEIPPFATITDIPSVWNQRDRAVAQWDGSVNSPFWRNIAAALPIVGDPRKVDLHNVGIVAGFLNGLPAAPYPFEVDMARAVRGEALFRDNCAACHKPLNATLYQYREIGTDMNRAAVLNAAALKLFLAGFGASCNDPGFKYVPPGGQAVLPCQMAGDEVITGRTAPGNQGYVTSVLDGIWARAPYLHNGSVPTMYHLLVPDQRPAAFLRGAIEYDREKLGFAWQTDELGRLVNGAPTLMLYDTRRDAHSNAGHDRDLVVDGAVRRLNWSGPQHADQVRDLIEYLKTR